MLRKVLLKLTASGWILLGLLYMAALFSYHETDVSLNTASSGVPQNWLGAFGAYVADFSYQWIGGSAWLLAVFCLVKGGRQLTGHSVSQPVGRSLSLLGLVFLMSFLLGASEKGGVLGFFFYRYMPALSAFVLGMLWLVFGVGLLYAFGVPLVRFLRWMWNHRPYQGARSFVAKPAAPSVRQAPSVKKEKKSALSKPQAKPAAPVMAKKRQTNGFVLPSVSLLDDPKNQSKENLTKEMMENTSRRLEAILAQFGVKGEIVRVSPGPVVTLYEFEPAAGVKTSRVIGLAEDIARAMSVVSVRMAVVPGSSVIGIEMPNKNRQTVFIKELIDLPAFTNHSGALPMILGKNIGGNPFFADLAKMPHLLVAGTTGSGKSVGINTMILSLLYRFTPEECRLIMVDPKMLELSVYNGIPHLLTPVVTEPGKAVVALKWAVREMEDRYRAMSSLGVRNIDGYNKKLADAAATGKSLTRKVQTGFDPETGRPIIEEQEMDKTPLPYIVVIVDEMADLMLVAGKDVEAAIQRLAQMARAAGIHLIMATQRPSVDVITGTIKANFPTRISFQVTSKIDSRTILGEQGAEQLLGRGDMLYMAAGLRPVRLHGPFVSDDEIERVVSHLKEQGEAQYVEAVTAEEEESFDEGAVFDRGQMGGEGDLYEKAKAIVLRDKKPSISYVQRQLRIGYNRAADLIDRMEAEGVISKASPTGRREILMGGE